MRLVARVLVGTFVAPVVAMVVMWLGSVSVELLGFTGARRFVVWLVLVGAVFVAAGYIIGPWALVTAPGGITGALFWLYVAYVQPADRVAGIHYDEDFGLLLSIAFVTAAMSALLLAGVLIRVTAALVRRSQRTAAGSHGRA